VKQRSDRSIGTAVPSAGCTGLLSASRPQRQRSTMFIRISILFLAAVSSGTSWAQFARAEGTYSSRASSARVILLDGEKGVAAASVQVLSGACSGSVAGIGEIRGRLLTITPYEKIPGEESCKIELAFDGAWRNVKITGQGCQAYSGAACGFEGQTAARRDER
jgi:hypothetical protein